MQQHAISQLDAEIGQWVRRYDLLLALFAVSLGLVGEANGKDPSSPPPTPAPVFQEPATPQLVATVAQEHRPAPVLRPAISRKPYRKPSKSQPQEDTGRTGHVRVVIENLDAERHLRAAGRATVVVGEDQVVDFSPSGEPVLTELEHVDGNRYSLRTAPSLRRLFGENELEGKHSMFLSSATAQLLNEVVAKFGAKDATICLGATEIRVRRDAEWNCTGSAEFTRRL